VALIYFDTDAFRHFSTAFKATPLSQELRRSLRLSPITAVEVMSQLVTKERAVILEQIHAMHNWLPRPALLMPTGNRMFAEIGFGIPHRDDLFDGISKSLDTCLDTE
jgi:hypothetical protein